MINIQEVQRIHESICNQARALCAQRGEEYAVPEDTLATFRQAALVQGKMPSEIVDVLIGVKVSRLLNGDFKLDTVYDLINYLVYKVIFEEHDL